MDSLEFFPITLTNLITKPHCFHTYFTV
uniref:Uncharacterized protein n=1 Tax=Lotus japonicus TaxID=34305 RepID=I3S701_LOTJA|nr:unknown [Lotus japonicus]